MVLGSNGQLVSAHLVSCVTVGNYAVSSHNDSWGARCRGSPPGSGCLEPCLLAPHLLT